MVLFRLIVLPVTRRSAERFPISPAYPQWALHLPRLPTPPPSCPLCLPRCGDDGMVWPALVSHCVVHSIAISPPPLIAASTACAFLQAAAAVSGARVPSLAALGYPPAGTTPFEGGETAALARMAGARACSCFVTQLACRPLPSQTIPVAASYQVRVLTCLLAAPLAPPQSTCPIRTGSANLRSPRATPQSSSAPPPQC